MAVASFSCVAMPQEAPVNPAEKQLSDAPADTENQPACVICGAEVSSSRNRMMGTDQADDRRGQLSIEFFGSAGHTEGSGEGVVVAVLELLRHDVHANLICIDKCDRQ